MWHKSSAFKQGCAVLTLGLSGDLNELYHMRYSKCWFNSNLNIINVVYKYKEFISLSLRYLRPLWWFMSVIPPNFCRFLKIIKRCYETYNIIKIIKHFLNSKMLSKDDEISKKEAFFKTSIIFTSQWDSTSIHGMRLDRMPLDRIYCTSNCT